MFDRYKDNNFDTNNMSLKDINKKFYNILNKVKDNSANYSKKVFYDNIVLPKINTTKYVNEIKYNQNRFRSKSIVTDNLISECSQKCIKSRYLNYNTNKNSSISLTNIRNKIQNVKKQVKESNINNNSIISNINKNYFSTANLNLIYESNTIIKDKLNKEIQSNEKEKFSFNKYVNNNKEIFIKNYIIKLLKKEQKYIKIKEDQIKKVILNAEEKLEKDVKDFNIYIDKKANLFRINEDTLNNEIILTKELQDIKRKNYSEYVLNNEELQKKIKISFELMTNVYFISYVFKTIEFLPTEAINFLENNFDRNSKFEYSKDTDNFLFDLVPNIISTFSGIKYKIPSNPNDMILRISDIENKILKKIEKNQELEKQKIKYIKEKNDMEIHYQLKIKEMNSELESLKKESFKIDNINYKYKDHTKVVMENNNAKILKTIKDFNSIILKEDDSIISIYNSSYNKSKKNCNTNLVSLNNINFNNFKSCPTKITNECINVLINNLKVIEKTILNKMSLIENIYKQNNTNEILNEVISKRIEHNKEVKIKEQKIKKQINDNYKKEKAKERMKRIVIRGKKVNGKINLKENSLLKKNLNTNLKSNTQYHNEKSLIYYSEDM